MSINVTLDLCGFKRELVIHANTPPRIFQIGLHDNDPLHSVPTLGNLEPRLMRYYKLTFEYIGNNTYRCKDFQTVKEAVKFQCEY